MRTDDSTISQNAQALSFTILGEPASKANQRRLVHIRSTPMFIKSAKAMSYGKLFKQQCPVLEPLIEDDVRLTIHIWYASRRPDLDESLILDLMQGCIYVNDRQVKERHCFWHLDKDNPRTDITVEVLPTEKKPRTRRG